MDKEKKKKIKRIIALVLVVVVVVLLAQMPLLTKQQQSGDGPVASILSGTVEKGSVNTEVIGGGTISEEDAVVISVPSSVKLTEYLVSDGAVVSEGDPIASVDRVTVMTAISELQETLDYLAEAIETESEKDTDSDVSALAGGTVKILYATEGTSVQDIMLKYGSLAVLSLDGLMAVDVTTDSDLAAGTTVDVILPDGTYVDGKIESNLSGEMTVTIEDDDYRIGDTLQVVSEDGVVIGSGTLYIYSPWNATAYAGTVSSINVSEGDKVEAGKTLMKLTDAGYTATYRQLVNQRQKYEDLMLQLFEMYQTEKITAFCDGIVSGIDEDSTQLLTTGEQSFEITFLANSPNGDDDTLYSNFIGKVTAVGQNGWGISMCPDNIAVEDYMNLEGISWDTSFMTELIVYNPNQTEGASVPVYELQNGAWMQINSADITAGDILLFAGDSSGDFVWIVRIQKNVVHDEPEVTEKPDTTETPEGTPVPELTAGPITTDKPSVSPMPDNSQKPVTSPKPDMPAGSGTTTVPGTQTNPGTSVSPGASAPPATSYPSSGGAWNGTGSYPQGGMMEQEPEYELYSMDVVQVASVTPQSTVTIDITVNELDVNSLGIGMTAEVKVDALGGEKFNATITDISNTGSNNGGYSYFTVELTLDRAENMLVGMNASATIVTATASEVLIVPVEALAEEGTETVIYTGYDEENEILINPVTVTAGVSDGQTVEIIDGLDEGVDYYYAYYDTLETSFTPDFGSSGFGGFSFGR